VYVAADRGAGDENEGNGNMRILDLKNQYVGTALTEGDMGGTNRGRALAFLMKITWLWQLTKETN
ncbi:MAG: hypothetical protein ACLU18_22310, partial [Bacteroides thetaiotaomicron]